MCIIFFFAVHSVSLARCEVLWLLSRRLIPRSGYFVWWLVCLFSDILLQRLGCGMVRAFQSDKKRPECVYWTILNVSIHMQSLMLYSLFFTSGVKGSENTTHVCRVLLKTSVDDLPLLSPVFEASSSHASSDPAMMHFCWPPNWADHPHDHWQHNIFVPGGQAP